MNLCLKSWYAQRSQAPKVGKNGRILRRNSLFPRHQKETLTNDSQSKQTESGCLELDGTSKAKNKVDGCTRGNDLGVFILRLLYAFYFISVNVSRRGFYVSRQIFLLEIDWWTSTFSKTNLDSGYDKT